MDRTPVKIKRRILTVLAMFTIGLVGMMFRLAYVQVVEGALLQERAFDQHTRDRNISPTRGDILDVNGEVIATSASVFTIGVVKAQVIAIWYSVTTAKDKNRLQHSYFLVCVNLLCNEPPFNNSS